jgi:hypothetical protein
VILINLLHAAVDNKSKANDDGKVMQEVILVQTLSAGGVQGLHNNGSL